ncbi:MAG: hypothetical protein WKG00_08765 [Polyangiaceae bacterium]
MGLVYRALAIAGLVGVVSDARAQATDAAIAESLYRQGRALMDTGRLAEACPKLAESQRIEPQLGTLLNLAVCHERLGLTASAWSEFNAVAAQAAQRNEGDRARYARAHAAALEPELSYLWLRVAERAPGLTVELDQRALGPAAWSNPLPVDPGAHRVKASVPGKRTWAQRIEVRGRGTTTLEVPALADAAVSGPVEAPPPQGGSTTRAVGLVVGGVGVAGVAVGAAFGLMTFSARSDGDEHCPGNHALCDETGLDLHDRASTYATVSTLAFAGGLAAVAVGTVLVLTSGSAPRAPAHTAGVRLVANGVIGRF